MAKITAPNKEYNGQVGDVVFAKGVAETDNPAVIAYAKAAGYEVEESTEGGEQPDQHEDPETPGQGDDKQPAGNASKEDWAAYAIARGIQADTVADLGREEIKTAVSNLNAE